MQIYKHIKQPIRTCLLQKQYHSPLHCINLKSFVDLTAKIKRLLQNSLYIQTVFYCEMFRYSNIISKQKSTSRLIPIQDIWALTIRAKQKGRRAKRPQNKKGAREITILRHRYIQGRNFFR